MSTTNQDPERAPLLQKVPVADEPRQRYAHNRIRISFSVVLALICIACFGIFLLPYPSRTKLSTPVHNTDLTYDQLVDIFLNTPDEKQVREWSKYYTSGPHLAGKNLSQAEWTRDRWQEFGVEDSTVIAYDIFVNYPKSHRLALLETTEAGTSVKYEAKLEEDVLEEDPSTGLTTRIPTFHGYSASGDVTAQYVFANYGTFKDYDDLVKANVSLEGKISLVKYGHCFRGLKVKRAQELGMIGVIIYSDPGDDGVTERTNATYPEGPARESSSVERGSTQFLSFAPGDPTTPGYPSLPGVPRQNDTSQSIAKIPSIPISYADALPLLLALNGHGPKSTEFNEYWQTGGLGYKGVEYNIGPSPPSLTLNLMNDQEYVTTPFWNVIGIVNGTTTDEAIILGNHRDAWIAGGAADPNSGSAAFNELIRGIGIALAHGWKPRRTIVLASWDGEEYGLVGSTEWVEEYLPWLSDAAVAYLNVDVGAAGSTFGTSSAPLINRVLQDTLSLVLSPNQTIPGQTVYDLWSKKISTIGSGSDYTAFQDFAGVPSVDMGFHTAKPGPVYHYHSNYDSFYWMDTYGDPGWVYHTTIAKVWALLMAKFVEAPIIPFNATDYATAFKGYVKSIEKQVRKAAAANEIAAAEAGAWSLSEFDEPVESFYNAAVALDAEGAALTEQLMLHPSVNRGSSFSLETALHKNITKVNDKYKFLERQFLYAPGLDKRSWFKHVVYAPGRWTGYAGAVFPGLVESVEDDDKENFEKWKEVIIERVKAAVALLEDEKIGSIGREEEL